MPANVSRLLERFRGGTRTGQGSNSASGSFTDVSPAGYQTMSGCARVRKSIYLLPAAFSVPLHNTGVGASPGTENTCSVGSMVTGCALFPINASAITTCATTNLTIPALISGVASAASRVWAVTLVPKPRDADTTGSIIAYVDWTYGSTAVESGCKKSMTVSLGYLNGHATTPATVRTAASAGGASIASYVGTACGRVQSTCLGALPSFSASDNAALVLFQLGASAASEDGTLITACTMILGIRLDYLANSLGTQSTE